MKIALIHDWLIGMRGGEKVLQCLHEAYPQADIYTLFLQREKLSPQLQQAQIFASFLDKIPMSSRVHRYFLPFMPMAIESFDLRGYDLIISSSHCVAKGVICDPAALHISYVHTPMRYAYEQFSDYFGSGIKSMLLRPAFTPLRIWDEVTEKRVDYFIANSNFIAQRIQKRYGRKAKVIFPPVSLEQFRVNKKTARKPYYLIVSALVPYKKVELAVQAFAKLPKRQLVIIGDGPERRNLEKIATRNVQFLGAVQGDELGDYYAACQAFIMPGLEDFGITPLEAQASGRPVIAYGKGGVLDTVKPLGGGAKPTGVFFHEQSPPALCEAIFEYERNASAFSSPALRRHAQAFSAKRFKQEIMAFVEHACHEKGIL